MADQLKPGIKFLKVLIFVALGAGALNVVTYAVEAWHGTLDTYALYRFIPKFGFGLVLIGYVLRCIRTRTSSLP